MATEYNREMAEIVQLLAITRTDLTALRSIEFMPAGERRMLGNIRKLVKLIGVKLLALPMPPATNSQMLSMEILFSLKAYRDGKYDRAERLTYLMRLGLEINTVVFLLDLVDAARGALVDLPVSMGGDIPDHTSFEREVSE